MDIMKAVSFCVFCFFNDTATTEIYTLSLHDALPICVGAALLPLVRADAAFVAARRGRGGVRARARSRGARRALTRGARNGARRCGVRLRGEARAGDRRRSRDPALAGRDAAGAEALSDPAG